MTTIKVNKKSTIKDWLVFIAIAIIGIAGGTGIGLSINTNNQNETEIEIVAPVQTLELSEEQIPAAIDDKGEIKLDENIPTVEEVDGGKFEDINTGMSAAEWQYADLGWSEYYDVSSPEAFKNATLGKCIIANNIYGAQCVSLARVFWWSYADRDVSTCQTGAAKGMMNCSLENAGDEFEIYWADSGEAIQAGDWLIFTGGQYGHVGMALGPVVNGYVALLGENQGGRACEGGGSSTNIINISIKNLIGFYRPKAYIIPEPLPITPDTGAGRE